MWSPSNLLLFHSYCLLFLRTLNRLLLLGLVKNQLRFQLLRCWSVLSNFWHTQTHKHTHIVSPMKRVSLPGSERCLTAVFLFSHLGFIQHLHRLHPDAQVWRNWIHRYLRWLRSLLCGGAGWSLVWHRIWICLSIHDSFHPQRLFNRTPAGLHVQLPLIFVCWNTLHFWHFGVSIPYGFLGDLFVEVALFCAGLLKVLVQRRHSDSGSERQWTAS